MNLVSPSPAMSPTRTQLHSAHGSPHLLPMPPPAFSRHSSNSDASDGSDVVSPNGRNGSSEPQPGSRLSYTQASPSSFGAQQSPSAASDTSRHSRGSVVPSNDDSNNDGEASGDFTQTFYDPFRIKHRRRTTPNQLKILEYHFEHNPKPDVTLRKALSEQLDMTPREVQVWFQNRRAKTKKLKEKAERDRETGFGPGGFEEVNRSRPPLDSSFGSAPRISMGQHRPAMNGRLDAPLPPLPHPLQSAPPGGDYLSLRRGSSPAVLSPHHLGSNGNTYYEPPSMHRGHNTYGGPRRDQQQPSFYAAHPNLPPPPLPIITGGSNHNVYPSPMSVSGSGLSTPSPSELQPQPFDYIQSPPVSHPNVGDHSNGRRFSLPAYNSNYSTSEPQQPQHFNLPPPPFGSTPYASPPLDVQSLLTEMNFVPIDGYDAPREDGYSPPSSGDEPFVGEYPSSSFASPTSNAQQPFPLSQYTFGGPSTHDSSFANPQPFENLAHGGPPPSTEALFALNERRASCPAGFIPTFDHLALSSPPSAPAPYPAYPPNDLPLAHQQPPLNLQRRHSLAPTSPSYTSTSPSQGGFFGPQGHVQARRGSTSAPLGTINEGAQLDQGRAARRVRSQRELGPYGNRPGESLRRSPGPSHQQQDSRRDSLTDWTPPFAAMPSQPAAPLL